MLLAPGEVTTLPGVDLCIIGAGPAGLTLAAALAGSPHRIMLLESGGLTSEEFPQTLNEGVVVGAAYAGLRSTRHRQVGGSARLWNTPVGGVAGAKYAMLEPRDFTPFQGRPASGWPWDFAELLPFYREALQVCGLGEIPEGSDREFPDFGSSPLTAGWYRFATAARLLDPLLEKVIAADNVTLCHGATVLGLQADGSGRRIGQLTVHREGPGPVTLSVRCVVLAAGAIENPRLLMLPSEGRAPLDPGGWLGRCFMEHPRDYSIVLELQGTGRPAALAGFDQHPVGDAVVAAWLGARPEALAAADLPSFAATLLPLVETRRSVLARVLRREPAASPGYGWSRRSGRVRICQVVLNLEQLPDRENRLVLDEVTDRSGLPRMRLLYRWTEAEQAGLDRLRQALSDWLSLAGIGRLRWKPGVLPDLSAHHHAGTTRMHQDPLGGVVDPELRVHGLENVFVTGASVFPRAGWANPTLTIVALSLRLVRTLRQVLEA